MSTPRYVDKGLADDGDLFEFDDMEEAAGEGEEREEREEGEREAAPTPAPPAPPPPSHPCWSCREPVPAGSPTCPECLESTRHVRLISPEASIDRRFGTGPPLQLGRDPVWAQAVAVELSGDKGKGVSRRHANVELTPDGTVWLTEHPGGTTNGTYVNGVQIGRGARIALRDGDVVGLGRHFAFTVLTVEPDA
ncbi:FHA domain-containing protein [Streptomyces sp. NBC_01275]|uniref:FHA domain-containing protein n=1 Tax=Streptomyces sp. NBC_01275 TaxID=2903807 RepID=UPI002253EDCE|nr:FHA domain-containing protein [Streptomyces sp. NBC_01275]MCX4764285.1 FHA domain-containing protein [Streptomyces sp. NBC_01275]